MNPKILELYNFPSEHKILFILIVIWTLVWKGLALWKAGRKNDPVWFVIMLVANTFGILDIIYIYHLADRKRKEETKN